jgi:hypothetical protein
VIPFDGRKLAAAAGSVELDGSDLTRDPIESRKALLAHLVRGAKLAPEGGIWRLPAVEVALKKPGYL